MSEKYPYIPILLAPVLPAELQAIIDEAYSQLEQSTGITGLFDQLAEKSLSSQHALVLHYDDGEMKCDGPFSVWRGEAE